MKFPRILPNMANMSMNTEYGCTRQPMRSSAPNALRGMIDIGAVILADSRIVG